MLFAGSLFLSSFYFSLLAVDLMLLKAAEMLPAQIGSFHAFAHDQWKSKHFPCHFAKAPSASAGKENSVFFFFPPALALRPGTDKYFLAFITAPCAGAGYSSYPRVSSAWLNALFFLPSIATGASRGL